MAARRGESEQERRRFERLRHRLTCELHAEGRKTNGVVVDVSPRGLFVRTGTGTTPPAGTELRVVLQGAGFDDMELRAVLARTQVVRRELVSAGAGGIGLEIVWAPEAYYRLLVPLMTDGDADGDE